MDALITIIFMLVSSSETQVQVQDIIVNLGINTSVSGEFFYSFSLRNLSSLSFLGTYLDLEVQWDRG